MFIEVILVLFSLVAGWYGRDLLDALLGWIRRRRAESESKMIRKDGPCWLNDYYTARNEGDKLFCLENGRRIPYLTCQKWNAVANPNASVDVSIVPYKSHLPINAKLIKRRQRAGQKIWDDEVLCLAGLVDRGNRMEVCFGTCSYYQYITASDTLYGETIKALRRSRPVPIRDAKASTIEHLSQARLEAQIAGFTVATVLSVSDCKQVLIQRRARETGVAGDRMAVVPAFVANTSQVIGSTIDISRLLFYIELLEELYDREELTQTLKRPSLDWIFETWPVNVLEKVLDNGFEFRRLGIGFDAHTGEFHQAYIAHVHDEQLSTDLLNRMRGSWEVQGVDLYPILDDSFNDVLFDDNLYPTSAFTLSLARRALQEELEGNQVP